jgi:hypothetical protein
MYPISYFKEIGVGKVTYQINNGAEKLEASIGEIANIFAMPLMTIINLTLLF